MLPVEEREIRVNAFVFLLLMLGVAALAAPFLRRDSTVVRFALIAFAVAVTLRYFAWRIANVPPVELSLYWFAYCGLLVLEGVATYLTLDDLLLLKRTKNRTPEVDKNLDWHLSDPPQVDVLIATYNESWEVLEKTIVGATNLDYPRYRVWILDDGNRAWLREKAETCNVGYLTRTENTHYKAGNLNHGVSVLRARGLKLEFLALLDADFIPRPDFVRRTIALMKTPDIGIVQTPQCFYNPDPHQQSFGGVRCWPDEQRGWFDMYLPALDAMGAATCCGTSCLIRVEALDAIGGFPTASVCEDTLSSIKMSQQGWKTAYLHERLTVGLAPEGIGEFLTQRARWLLGGVQNTRYLSAGPGIWGRLKYWLGLWRSAIWGAMTPVWISLCILYWFTGASLIKVTDSEEATSFFGPLWLVRIFQGWLFGGRELVFVADAVWLLLAPLWMRQTYRAVVGSNATFKVTDKAQHRDKVLIHWSLLTFHGPLALLLILGLVYTLIDPTAPGHHEGFFQPYTYMTLWFLAIIVAGLAPVIEAPKRRSGERYATSETVVARVGDVQHTWHCVDVSLGGVLVRTENCERPAGTVELTVSGVGTVRADVVRTHARNLTAFAFRDPAARPALIRKLYCTDDYIPVPEGWGIGKVVWSFFKRLLF